jgi:hypothetical protein
MPYVSMFFGIIIRMFHNDHDPPHFHAEYQGGTAKFDLDGNLITGNIKSRTARSLIKKWAAQHKNELTANWETARKLGKIHRIDPLD